jgi:predicted GNAT superfamily acetyltransferase
MYLNEHYGKMRDGLNAGLPSDRFQVELWVNSSRVLNRFSRRPRRRLELEQYLAGGAVVINPAQRNEGGFPAPSDVEPILEALESREGSSPILLLEIPSDIQSIKASQPALALKWRHHTRRLFTDLFETGYLVTDFVYGGSSGLSNYYVLSDGGAHLGGENGQ